jgi:hypothetical protein
MGRARRKPQKSYMLSTLGQGKSFLQPSSSNQAWAGQLSRIPERPGKQLPKHHSHKGSSCCQESGHYSLEWKPW